MLSPTYVSELRTIGVAAGLDRVGVASAAPFWSTRSDLLDRRERGLHADMQFTYRNPDRSTDPSRTLDSVRSLVVGARAYPPPPGAGPEPEGEPDFGGHDRGRPSSRGPRAHVASYVVGDHYGALRAGLDAIAARLVADGHRARVLLDDNALVDRAAAHRAGLGWFGKNANLLVEGIGSWVVLGSVLTNAVLPPAPAPVPDGCGGCTRCLDGCPTGAIVEPGVVDARRCLAWLLQARGTFPVEHRVALGARIYGCDECQEVCPPSRRAVRTGAIPVRAVAVPPTTAPTISVLHLLGLDDDELLAEVGRWYLADRDPNVVRRNALIVLANAASVPVEADIVEVVDHYLGHAEPMLRGHAVWAAQRLGLGDLAERCRDDPDAGVLAELAHPVPARAGSSLPASFPAGAHLP